MTRINQSINQSIFHLTHCLVSRGCEAVGVGFFLIFPANFKSGGRRRFSLETEVATTAAAAATAVAVTEAAAPATDTEVETGVAAFK